ncbi:MAG TPA: hypothetical protein VMH39_08045, partial [Gemmatimonadaceae bacterium]|nr:hypothetical protein [Gemmatimonadaceae bacterium]
ILSGASAAAPDEFHACALLANQTVHCFGNNGSDAVGMLGSLTGVTAVTVGSAHSCALLSDGTVQCWGDNEEGQLGNGDSTNPAQSNTPIVVQGVSGATAISAGPYHTCALIGDGTIQCWGDGTEGALGNGTTNWGKLPTAVTGIQNAVGIAAGGDRNAGAATCAVLADGTVRCWGMNNHGLMGNGSTSATSTCEGVPNGPCELTPVAVPGLSGVTAVSVGLQHACALQTGGQIMCWGSYGVALGLGRDLPSLSGPVNVVW